MKGTVNKFGMAILAVATLIGALVCFQLGFTQLSEVRQIDRLPISPVSALADGIYAVSGRIESKGQSVTAPYSNDRVVYYEYLLQEERRDSDGKPNLHTIDSGASAINFLLRDASGVVEVKPGFQISQVDWQAERTFRNKSGNKIYTEWTFREGDAIELLAWFNPADLSFNLSEWQGNLNAMVTVDGLASEGGKGLFGASLLVSLAAGLLAVSLAAALAFFGVHRYWVFVAAMTAGLMIVLWSVGLYHLQKDWRNAAGIYQQRANAVLADPSPVKNEDLYALYFRIAESASQWPDSALFKQVSRNQFPLPNVSTGIRQQIEREQSAVAHSHYDQQGVAFGLAIAGAMFTAVLLFVALKAIRFKRLVEFIPTSQSTGLAYGLSELFGMIEVDDELPFINSHLNQNKCVAYRYAIEEKRGSGKKAKWVTIDSGEQTTTFWLEDELGRVAIDPVESEIRFPEKHVKREGQMRYTEYWLPPYRNVYCLGFAGISPERSDKLTLQNSDDFRMLITTQEEEEVVKGKGSLGFLLTGLALGCSLMAGTVLLAASGMLTPLDLIKTSLIVPLLLTIVTIILHYNGLVFLRNRVDKTRADIDTLLQRRHDLWPQLFNTVEGFMQHETKLLTAIGKLRSGEVLTSQNPDQVDKQIAYEGKVMQAFNARIESYPELKANSLVQKVSRQMQASEDELALIRQGYNDSVELYNTQTEKLPDVILARLFGFKKAEFFQQDD
ncbi:LemA family protein [Reinekea marinisedimentorum]|uniref:RING-type E3 ubiquitin transferase n=1 Tax=Reinekea marinisedimentorum TaxID=230495 RepID=A0A4R3ICI2_9GAMM|nr:LemA family protein [Reinekea marinisedimentorum]TCS43875.1 hypothetical protein BCF53_101218 [Reinekea marinisedimentorum]